jgi:hypothetical protein
VRYAVGPWIATAIQGQIDSFERENTVFHGAQDGWTPKFHFYAYPNQKS